MSTTSTSNSGTLYDRRLSAPKVDEAFKAHGQSGHRFNKKSFTRPTYCHHCTEMLWGFTNQGFICDVCNFVTHERCLTTVITPCVSIATTLVTKPLAHTWGGVTFYKRKYCGVCRKRLEDNPALKCQDCEYFIHEACKEFNVSDCKQSATFVAQLNELSAKHSHHWREGNLSASAKCVLCKRTCGTTECLASYRCSWCAQTAHSGCFELLPKECQFGYIKRLSLPPYCVSSPSIELWGNWRKAITSRSKLGNVEEEKSTLVLNDQRIPVRTSSPPMEEKDVTSLNVYDGNLNSPKTCKSVVVPRNARVGHILTESMKKFCINDEPDNYYLVKAVNSESEIERPLDCEEMPIQFPENEERPLIFLRMKNANRKKGYIRIYSGMELNVSATFKTILVGGSTTVRDVIQEALPKFDLMDASKDDYVLTEMQLHSGLYERCMEEHECPWKRQVEVKKRSVVEFKGLRFYLRHKLEPTDNVCLCVGNLPTYLDKPRYEALLKEVVKQEYLTIDYIHPSSGMLFASLPSADLATVVIERLRQSPIDGKDVFVKLLPTIHPEMIGNDCKPLLVFVNPKSGGGQGDDILSAFHRLLNPHQVYNLLDGGPLPGLYVFKNVEKFQILICGGDGTVGWVLSCLDDMSGVIRYKKPPSAIVPLGTGNDLSRVLNWGGGYSSGDTPLSLLMAVDHAEVGLLDRWFVMFDSYDTLSSDNSMDNDEPNMFVMNNYFGIGVDADLSLDFHLQREESPEKFTSRLHNKGVYFRAGLRKMAKRSSFDLSNEIEIEVDGEQIALPGLEGIVILNIASWAAGADVWGADREDKGFRPSCHNDGVVEIVGLTGIMQMGQIQSGIRSGVRIAQGSQINIKLKSELAVQVDGEPWMQPAGQIIIRPSLIQAAVLTKRKVKVKTHYQQAAASRPTSAPISRSTFYRNNGSGYRSLDYDT